MKIPTLLKLLIAIGISEFVGIIGSFFTVSAIPAWYSTLTKPTVNPPSWVFSPVWTTLYFLMGVAAFLVWQKGLSNKNVRVALVLFGIQLFLNALWSILFFGLQSPGLAFIDIIALWLVIVATMVAFYKISRPASYLLIPYLLWVSFAAYLNYSIWILN